MKLKDISAMLDSNGKTVRMEPVIGTRLRVKPLPVVGEIYKFNGNRFRVAKVLKTKVWMDKIDSNDQPIDGYSGDRGFTYATSLVQKSFNKQ